MDNAQANEAAAITSGVFPLRLTPIEKYFLWDDRPLQPLTPICELDFAAELDQEILAQAIASVIAQNPILNARVIERGNEQFWVPSTEPILLQKLDHQEFASCTMMRPMDLRNEAGCRFWYGKTETGSRLTWQVHHCCCDGVAMRNVLIDVLHSYAMATDAVDAPAHQDALVYNRYRIESLQQRYRFSHLGAPRRKLTTWQRVRNAHYFHFQPPRPLIGSLQKPEEQAGPPLCHLSFDRELSEQVLSKCQANAIGVNELAIAILFQTCARWNQQRGDRSPRSRLRILMPYDLRGRSDVRMPATNRLSLTFFGRVASQCEDVQELVDSISREIATMKDTHLYLDFLNGFEMAVKWPRLTQWAMRKSHSMATAALTYTGDISRGMGKLFPDENGNRRVGHALLRSIRAAPPVRRNTNISLGLCINWGQINISAAWNREVISRLDCEQFLELYRQGWQAWVAIA